MKKVAIVQSNFIPWRGYFSLIRSVDEFIILDSVQYTRRDWRNRNKIKSQNGVQWLTIPTQSKGNYSAKVNEIRTLDSTWKDDHLNKLKILYGKSPFFDQFFPILQRAYGSESVENLSDFNVRLLKEICCYLGFTPTITLDTNFSESLGSNQRLINLCKATGGQVYVTGPKAKSYLAEDDFTSQGLNIEWFTYSDAHIYQQQWGEFIPDLSIIDIIFNLGEDAHICL